MRKYTKILLIVVLAICLALPIVAPSDYIVRIAINCTFYVLLATSLNLLCGVAGQISLGHIGFYGIGAYTSALLALKLHMPFLVCLLAAAIFSAIMGFLISIPSLRMSGGYLAIITLSFSEVIRLILLNWMSLTRGPVGLVNIPSASIFGFEMDTARKYFYFVFAVCIVAILILRNIINSNFGRKLRAINDDEYASEAMGINNYRSKIITFTIASSIAGTTGSLFAHLMMYIDPSSFVSAESNMILSMVVLGGMGNLAGSTIAAVILTALPELMRGFAKYRMLVYGFVLIAMMLLKTVDKEVLMTKQPFCTIAKLFDRRKEQ